MTHATHQSTRRRVLKMSGAALAAAGIGLNAFAQEKQITIISDKSNPATRATLASIAAAFEKESGIKVVINNMDHEAHKTAIRNYLVASPPDLCFWFSGNRMRSFVERGLFDDVSDLYAKEKLFDVFGVSTGAVTVNGKQWGLPMNGTPWGMMYRKDVFAEKGLTVPKTLAEFKTMAEKAKAAGLVPLAMGAKDKWPVAGFFDHLNLRINGLDKHMALMNGDVAYTDPMLTAVFDRWEEMIKAGYFQANATSYGWQEAGALIVQKKAAMMALGPFISGLFPANEVNQVGFAAFPQMVSGMAQYENLAFNSIHIPSGAKNKALARQFLVFLYRKDNLAALLNSESGLSPRVDMGAPTDAILLQANEAFKNVKGTAQFYDRDTDSDMAQVGLNAFQEFSAFPERRKAIQEKLEEARKRIFKK